MPLMMIDLVAGRSEKETAEILEAVHCAVVEAFHVPPQDRYQIVREHQPSHLVVEDTGLGIPRSRDVVVVRVTSRPRTQEQKEGFYRLLCEHLQRRCNIPSNDVVVAITENTDADWSFGYGRAQFLTGEL